MTDDAPRFQYVEGRMRDTLEVRFYLEALGCPRCGLRECGFEEGSAIPARYQREHGGEARSGWCFDFTCPQCQLRRRLVFFEMDPRPEHVKKIDPVTGYREDDFRHLGGWEHSEIIAPHELARELAYCAAHVISELSLIATPDPERLKDDAVWRSFSGHLCLNAEKCTRELRKFIPEGAAEVPDKFFVTDDARCMRVEHPEWFRRTDIEATEAMWDRFGEVIDAEAQRRYALQGPEDPKAAGAWKAKELSAIRAKIHGDRLPAGIQVLKPAQLDAHAAWLRDGSTGERLRWNDSDAPGAKLAFLELSGAIINGGFFDRADVSSTRLHGAQLTRVRARGANFDHVMLAGSTIAHCDFAEADFALGNLGDASIADTDFSRAQLERTTWYRSKIARCTFAGAALHDAAFDHAELVDCDFRGADFSEGKRDILGTAFETTFIRCDFRDTKWLDRDLWRVRFVDCRFEGSSGPPWLSEVTFEGASALEIWNIPAHRPRPRDVEWMLRSDELDALTPYLTRNEIPFKRTAPDRMITQQLGTPIEPGIRDALKAYRRSLAPRVLAERVLDDAIDAGVSFSDTVERLIRVGFSRENALEIVVDPATARPLP